MGKTLKQIADELGVSKQRVYRFVKIHCISEAHQRNGTKYYDDAAEFLIKQGFLHKSTASEEAHRSASEVHQKNTNDAVIELLRQELQAKNKQIEELNARLAEVTAALTAEQALHAGTLQQQLLIEDKPKKHWWQRKR